MQSRASVFSRSAALIAGVVIAGVATAAGAWTGPQNTPPTCVAGQTGCDAPINVGTGSQVKNGNLSVNVFTATQNSLFYGSLGVGSSGAPSYTLDVTGTARVTGLVTAANIRVTGYTGTDILRLQPGDDLNPGYNVIAVGNAGWTSWPFMVSKSGNVTAAGNLSLGGNATITGNVTAAGYFHSSDASLKKDVQTSPGLALVEQLRGVTFDWKQDGTPSAGVIAQEVESVMPSAVHTDPKTGLKSVEYDQLIAPLIEAIKEQQVEIESLRHEVESLKTR